MSNSHNAHLVKIGKELKRSIGIILALAILLALPATATAQVVVGDGQEYENKSTINTATVNEGGTLFNHETGVINNATVNYDGWLENGGYVRVPGPSGEWWDYESIPFNGGMIHNATVNEGGYLGNTFGGRIGSVTLNDSEVVNTYGGNIGTITGSGHVQNFDGGQIDTVSITNGVISNYYEGYSSEGTSYERSYIGNATVRDGSVSTYYGEFGNLTLYDSYLGGHNGVYGDVTVNNGYVSVAGPQIHFGSLTLNGEGTFTTRDFGGLVENMEINGDWEAWNMNASVGNLVINGDALFMNYGDRRHGDQQRAYYASDEFRAEIRGWFDTEAEMEDYINRHHTFRHDYTSSEVANLELNNGTFWNSGGLVSEGTVNGGELYNTSGPGGDGLLANITINDGYVENQFYGTITNATLNGGTLENRSAYYRDEYYDDYEDRHIVHEFGGIQNLTYVAGTYNAGYDADFLEHLEYLKAHEPEYVDEYMSMITPTVNTVTLAGNSVLNTGDWGVVQNVDFHENGNGILTIAAHGEAEMLAFSGLQALQNIDFADGNITLDISGVNDNGNWNSTAWEYSFFETTGFDDFGFFLSDIFEAETFSNVEGLYSFGIDWFDETFWILNDGIFGAGWEILYDINYVQWDPNSGDPNVVPEPATLAIIGLGLAGLGLARRRRRK